MGCQIIAKTFKAPGTSEEYLYTAHMIFKKTTTTDFLLE
jgi:hypothetical protein